MGLLDIFKTTHALGRLSPATAASEPKNWQIAIRWAECNNFRGNFRCPAKKNQSSGRHLRFFCPDGARTPRYKGMCISGVLFRHGFAAHGGRVYLTQGPCGSSKLVYGMSIRWRKSLALELLGASSRLRSTACKAAPRSFSAAFR